MKFFRPKLLVIFTLILGCFISSPLLAQSGSHRLSIANPQNSYSANEIPHFQFQRQAASSSKFLFFFTRPAPIEKSLDQSLNYIFKNAAGKNINTSLISISNGDISINPEGLKPGKYTLEITDSVTKETITQDFTWGVLAINPDQSSYSPGDTAFLAMAVLDDFGNMVCNANVSLAITNPDGSTTTLSTQNNQITVNPVCHTKDVTLVPDYQATYQLGQTGSYQYTLTSVTENGTHSISGTIIVDPTSLFTVKRLAATRIYPPNNYPVTLKITANKNFTGTITESVPASFVITQTTAKITTQDNRKFLSWDISLIKNQTISLKYTYKAPLISPEYYLLGPLTFNQAKKTIYTEPRQWQIASDATATLTPSNTGFGVPSNVYVLTKIEAWGGGGGGASSGGATYAAGGGGGGGYSNLIGYSGFSPGDTLAVSIGAGGTSTANGGNTYFINTSTLLAIGGSGAAANSAVGAKGGNLGIGNTTKTGGIGATGAAASYGGGGGGGAGDSANGGNGSTSTHGTGGVGVGYSGGNGGDGRITNKGVGLSGSGPGGAGGGAFGGTGGTKAGGAGGDGQIIITYTVNNPPNQPTNSSPANGDINVSLTPTLIGTSYSDPESDAQNASQWQIASDSGFSTVVWDTGTTGSASNTINVGYTLTESTVYYWHVSYQAIQGNWSSYSVGTSFTTVPPSNNPPNLPSLVTPGTGVTNVSQTPSFVTVTTDPESDVVQYEVKICTNSGMSAGCNTFTAANVGWTNADVGTSSYSSGTTATYVLQTGNSLATNSTYYWKTRAIDPAGTNTYSSTQVTAYSFSTLNINPNQPTNSTPTNGTGGISLTPTLTASAFSDPDPGDTFAASQWQIATDSGFSSIVFDTGTTGAGTTSVAVTTTLSVGTTYYWQVRYRDNHSAWSNYSSYTNFTTDKIPDTPTNSTPTNGTGGISLTPTLTASAFSDPDPGDTFAASQWQIATDSGFSSIVFDTGTTGAGTTSVAVTTTLSVGTTYYWQVRYKDNYNNWSSYSSYTNFTTNKVPNQPSNSTPANLATGVTLTPTLTASAYSDPDSDAQAASQFQVATDSGFSSIVFDTGTTGPTSNTVNVTPALNYTTPYYWRVKYKDDTGNWSSFSSYTTFTTMSAPNIPPNTPTLIYPANSATGIGITPPLRLVTTDTNGDNLQYRIFLATDVNFSGTTQTFDLSSSAVGWSGINVGTSAYSSGTTAAYIIQSPLGYSTLYYWKSQAIDPAGSATWSSLSAGSSFTTVANQNPNTPTNTTPGVGVTAVSANPTMTASAFSDPDVGDTHANSQWQIDTNGTFSGTTVWDSGTSSNLTSIVVNTTNGTFSGALAGETHLAYSTQYYFHVRYRDNYNNWSSYSSATAFTTGAAPTPSAKLTADRYWKFDEINGTTTYDYSANRTTAVLTGTTLPVRSADCKLNYCLSFNGLSSKVNLNTISGLDFGSSNFSVSAWVYPTDTTGVRSIFSTSKGIFYIENGVLKYQKSSASWDTIGTGITITPNTWTYVAFSRTGTGADQSALYINGQLAVTGQIADLGTGATDPTIGYEVLNGRYFAGKIDELKVFSTYFQPEQVKVDSNLGHARNLGKTAGYSAIFCPPGDSTCGGIPVAEWKFDEGVGTTIYDTSGTGNHAIFAAGSSAPTWTTGKIGKALLFDGNKTYISSTNTISGIKSISFWIRPTTTTQRIIDFDGGTHYISASSGIISATGFTTPLIYVNGIGTSIITAGTWQHITVTTGTGFNGTAITVGKSTTNFFDGKIDQVLIYNYVRTPAEVAWDYNRGGPIGWWKFDECTGSTAYDWSGVGNTGAITIGAGGGQNSVGNCSTAGTAWGIGSTGKFNRSIGLDGTDDYVSTSTSNHNIATGDFTYSVWVKPTSLSGYRTVISNGTSAPGFYAALNGGNFGLSWGGDRTSGTGLSTGIWQNIIVTRTGSTVKFYLNGRQTPTTYSISTSIANAAFAFGSSRTDTANQPFSGLIDDVRIYNYAATQDQINLIYNNGAVMFRN